MALVCEVGEKFVSFPAWIHSLGAWSENPNNNDKDHLVVQLSKRCKRGKGKGVVICIVCS